GNTIQGNFIGTDRAGTAYATHNSQGVRQLNDASSSPNLYADNLVKNSSSYGFEIAAGLATISGNTISGSGDVAVDLKVNSGVRITKNSISGNGFPGILYEFADGNPQAPN